ncbi:MAG: 50S ribosomal protein L11 methyltransferase [Desulfobacterota bacterium]|nr:50S ribosomal protein L11 methyltransferase [Thermodesulfobacteriota bacterium]
MKRWLSLSLRLPKGLSEPLSNFLMEQGASGLETVEEDLERETLKAYFPAGRGERGIVRSVRSYLRSLSTLHSGIPPVVIETGHLIDQDWGASWKRFFKPIRLGSRLIVKPPWARVRAKRNEILIEIDPGMAFGTGTHATTQLCLRALEKRLKGKDLEVLDVGTGSGILAIAAARLGAKEVWGIDVDRAAVEKARENVVRNGVDDRVRLRRGRIGRVSKKFDLVVANIDFKSLKRMKRPLVNHLRDGGFLILSGILKTEERKIRKPYEDSGLLKWVETDRQREWICLTFQRKRA